MTDKIEAMERRLEILENKINSIVYIIGKVSNIIKDVSEPFDDILNIIKYESEDVESNVEALVECGDDEGQWEE